jgi:hypothetical protein
MEEHLKKRIAAKRYDPDGFVVVLGTGMNTFEDVHDYNFIKPVYKICCSLSGDFTIFNWTTEGKLKSYHDYCTYIPHNMHWKIFKRERWRNFFEAVKIQRAFKRAVSNPEYEMCRKRLLREFKIINTFD